MTQKCSPQGLDRPRGNSRTNVIVYSLDKGNRIRRSGIHLQNPAYSYNNPIRSRDFIGTLFRIPDEKQSNLNIQHYNNITRKTFKPYAQKESTITEILKENKQKLDLLFDDNEPAEKAHPVAKRQQNKVRITIIPKGPVVANHNIVPIHEDRTSNLYHFTGAKSGNVEKATDQKTEPHVTFPDQPVVNRDADLHLNPVTTETHDTMSSAVESFVPDAKVMARIQEKHELQDINDRFSQYIQVLQYSKASRHYNFVVNLTLHSLRH